MAKTSIFKAMSGLTAGIVGAIGITVIALGIWMLIDYGVKGLGHFYVAALAVLAAFSAAYVVYLAGFSAGRAYGRKEIGKALAETLSVEGPDSVLKTIKSGAVVPFEDMTSRPDTSDGGW